MDIDTQPEIETCAVGHDHERLRGRCGRCEIATRENTGGVDPTLIDAISFAFGAYPPSLIAASQLAHVSLCRTVRMDDGELAPAGVAIAAEHRLLTSVEHFPIDESADAALSDSSRPAPDDADCAIGLECAGSDEGVGIGFCGSACTLAGGCPAGAPCKVVLTGRDSRLR